MQEIADAAGFQSKGNASKYIRQLSELGYIEYKPGHYRAIKVIKKTPEMMALELLAEVIETLPAHPLPPRIRQKISSFLFIISM